MAETILFTPRAELDAQANLQGFIDACRSQLTAFGSQLNFDDNKWDVTDSIVLKAKNHKTRLVFSTWATANDTIPEYLPEPFLSFAKAYLRYQHALKPTKSIGSRIAALRALEAALAETGAGSDPTHVRPDTLNRAAQLVKDKFSGAVANRTAGQLEMVANFLADKYLMALPVRWRNPVKRPRDGVRVGEEFDKKRQEKLPSPAALTALAKVFHLATEPTDVLVSSIAAILCSAPDRINEVLHLEQNCEVPGEVPSTKEKTYGLRWRTSKGADHMVKWIIGSMVDVVKEAVANIRKLTQDARSVAAWYEKHPKQLYLPQHLEPLRSRDRLSMSELGDVLFAEPVGRTVPSQWCVSYGVKTENSDKKLSVAFCDVEAAVLALLPRGFPVASEECGLNYSNALCLILRNALHANKATYRCVIELVDQGDVYNRLGARSTSGIESIFDRFGFTEDDGRPIRIKSHQLRHWLNTLAQIGGLSQLDIAKWSGRKDVSQNKAYDHQSDRDIAALVRETVGDELRMFGPLAKLHKAALMNRDEFASLKIQTAHTTEFGYCIHDFSMLPCQIHGDCLNCDEQVCIKGDAFRESNIRRHREETRDLLEAAKEADEEGDAGADRWVEHQQKTLEHLDQLCEILDNPQVPKGAVVQLSGVVPASRLEQAKEGRKALGRPRATNQSARTHLPSTDEGFSGGGE